MVDVFVLFVLVKGVFVCIVRAY